MAITRTGNTISGSVQSGTSVTVTLPSTTVSGNFLACIISLFGGTEAFTVSDTSGGTWLTAVNYSNGAQVEVQYLENITGTASHAVTVTSPSADYFVVTVVEIAGLALTSSLDVTTTNRNTANTYSSGSPTTLSQAAEYVLGIHHIGNSAVNFVPDAGWSTVVKADDGSTHAHQVQDRISTTTGPFASTGGVGFFSWDIVSVLVSFKGPAPTLITGTIARSLTAPTCAASGTYTPLAISGTIDASTPGPTETSSGTETFSGTINASLIGGTLAITFADETFSGTIARSLIAPTCASSGQSLFTGTIARSLIAPTGASSGTQLFSGPIVADIASLTCAATGSYTPLNITGTIARSLSAPTCLATGTTGEVFTGTIAVSLSTPTGSSVGAETFSGTVARSLQAPSSAATGSETFSGTAAGSLSAPTGTSAGAEIFPGTIASSLSTPTCVAAGTETFSGTIAASLSVPTCLGAGTSGAFSGTIAASLSAPTCAASGSEIFDATAATSLGITTLLSSGGLTFSGGIAGSLSAPAVSAIGSVSVIVIGTIDAVLSTPTCQATGIYTPLPITGSIAGVLQSSTCIAWGKSITGVEISDVFAIPGIYAPGVSIRGLYDVTLPLVHAMYDPRILIKGISDVQPL